MTEGQSTFFDTVQRLTEAHLSRRNRNKRLRREKYAGKNRIFDWIDAIIWAMCMVLLANQYLVQAYQIPSGSMIDTLLLKDHVFVNKLAYGPEILPGVGKLPSVVKPQRNDIIIFESPEYLSRGPVFDFAQRVIFMLTLSRVDIDKNEKGETRVHFLIKRAAGVAGDHFTMRHGEMKVRFAGEDRFVDERGYVQARGWNHNLSRLMDINQYPALEIAVRASVYNELGLSSPDWVVYNDEHGLSAPEWIIASLRETARLSNLDSLFFREVRMGVLREIFPQESRYRTQYARRVLGWYVPEGRVLPMGDNRDASHDGRTFGSVKVSKVLGKGAFKYWPLWRFGPTR